MASLIFVLFFAANYLTFVGSGMIDEENTFIPQGKFSNTGSGIFNSFLNVL